MEGTCTCEGSVSLETWGDLKAGGDLGGLKAGEGRGGLKAGGGWRGLKAGAGWGGLKVGGGGRAGLKGWEGCQPGEV